MESFHGVRCLSALQHIVRREFVALVFLIKVYLVRVESSNLVDTIGTVLSTMIRFVAHVAFLNVRASYVRLGYYSVNRQGVMPLHASLPH